MDIPLNNFTDDSYTFKNIQITRHSDNLNLLDKNYCYFYKPEIVQTENETSLIIKPDTNKISELLKTQENSCIDVTILLSNVHNSSDKKIFNSDFSFSYSFNSLVSNNAPPQFSENGEFYIYKTKEAAINKNHNEVSIFNYSNGLSAWIKDVYKNASVSEQKELLSKYTLGNTIYLAAQIKDINLEKITITEIDNLTEFETQYYVSNKNVFSFDSQNNVYNFLTEYNFTLSGSGLIELKFKAYNGNGKSTELTYNIIKMSKLPNVNLYRITPELNQSRTKENVTLLSYFSNSINETIGSDNNEITYKSGFVTSLSSDGFNSQIDKIYYSYDKINYFETSNFKRSYIINGHTYYPSATESFERDCTKDVYIKVLYSDIWGNKGELNKFIPANISIIDASFTNNNVSLCLSRTPDYTYQIYYQKSNNTYNSNSSFERITNENGNYFFN